MFFVLVFLGVVMLLLIDRSMVESAKGRLYHDVNNVPAKKAVLVLGTAKYTKSGLLNYFYTTRIDATVKLWKANKVKAIVVSGDNGTVRYDEATTMYEDLIKAGVPKEYIVRDYAGFRTLDSIVRAEAIFDLKDYVIVSQKFHLERAIFLANNKHQKVVGFEAKDYSIGAIRVKMQLREYLARFKAFLDVYVFNTQPKFYGKKEVVKYRD